MNEEVTAENPPLDLRNRGARFWRDVLSKYELRVDEIAILVSCCRTLDEISQLEDALRKTETVTGAKPNALFAALRSHRLTYARLSARLGLDDASGSASA